MKKLHWILLLFILTVALKGQPSSDFGITAGTTSYIGDINPGRLFYSPLPAGGLIYRYNFHPRQAIRATLIAGGLRGSDSDFNNPFQNTRGASFSGITGELSLQFEFNFLPFSTEGRLWDYTPYIAGGGGAAFVNTTSFAIVPVIPFSLGFKVNIHKNVGLEVEYGFRKTFYDNFDGLNDLVAPEDYAWIHNNDWYSFAGVSITWKMFNKLAGCPAYNDMDSKSNR